jgi:adenylate cyclase
MFVALKSFNMQYSQNWQIRIGINTGPAVAGVVGKKKITYDLWSDDGIILFT